MYVHHDAKLVYLAHPKTASHATRTALINIGFESYAEHHTRMCEVDLHGFHTITTVRNHWDTVISWCANGRALKPVITPTDLVRALDTTWIKKGRLWWMHETDTVLHYETLGADLNRVLTAHGLPEADIPVENVNPRRSRAYRSYYTRTTQVFVRGWFSDEIEHFGYSF